MLCISGLCIGFDVLSRNPSQGCVNETMLGRDTSCDASRSKANPVCPPGHSAKVGLAEHGVGDEL